MKVEFKTKKFAFDVEFNDTSTSQKIIGKLPLKATTLKNDKGIYLDIGLDINQSVTPSKNTCKMFYLSDKNCLGILFPRGDSGTADYLEVPYSAVNVGEAIISLDELKEISSNEEVDILLIGKTDTRKKTEAEDTRILSQSEIDKVISKLLAEKRQKGTG